MALSHNFIKTRVVATRNVQEEIAADWLWQELDVAGWDAKIAALNAQEATERAAHTALETTIGQLNAKIKLLERQKVLAIGMAKNRQRTDAAKLSLLDSLEEKGDGRSATIEEAEDWLGVWDEIDPTWSPLPGVTVASFTTLKSDCGTLNKTCGRQRTAWRHAAEDLGKLLNDLDDLSVTWYDDATRVFAPGTPQGDLIRGQVPTTYTPDDETDNPPAPPSP